MHREERSSSTVSGLSRSNKVYTDDYRCGSCRACRRARWTTPRLSDSWSVPEPGCDKLPRLPSPLPRVMAPAPADHPRARVIRRPGVVLDVAAVIRSYQAAERAVGEAPRMLGVLRQRRCLV